MGFKTFFENDTDMVSSTKRIFIAVLWIGREREKNKKKVRVGRLVLVSVLLVQ